MSYSRWLLVSVAGLLVLGQGLLGAGPATRPAAEPEYRIGEVDIQRISAFTYASVHARTTMARLQQTIGVLMPRMTAAVEKGTVHPSGAMVFTYKGATGEMEQEFELQVGMFVDRPVAAGSGVESSEEPGLKCATLIYRGSLAHLKEAFGKLYEEIGTRGLTPLPISREVYLYWEGPDSPNNIIQLQAGVN